MIKLLVSATWGWDSHVMTGFSSVAKKQMQKTAKKRVAGPIAHLGGQRFACGTAAAAFAAGRS